MYLDSADPKTERIAHIYKIYRQELLKVERPRLRRPAAVEVHVLKPSGEAREKYQRRYQYMLVDEYQDTNRPQYEIMCALAGSDHNVCAVGDEDQSIYSWRGADINNILDFEKDFPEAKIIRLEQNYRSTQPILQAASAVVANNLQRKGKNLWTARRAARRSATTTRPTARTRRCLPPTSSPAGRRRAPARAEKQGAILYRTNSQSRLMEEALRRYKSPTTWSAASASTSAPRSRT